MVREGTPTSVDYHSKENQFRWHSMTAQGTYTNFQHSFCGQLQERYKPASTLHPNHFSANLQKKSTRPGKGAKVASTDGYWKRSCGFRGFESLKEEALQDLCGVTLQVFYLLLNLLLPPRYRCNASQEKTSLFLTKL